MILRASFNRWVLLIPALLGCASNAQAYQAIRGYFIGNSLTEGINLPGLQALAATRGDRLDFGKHTRSGASLQYIWENPADGWNVDPYGYYPNALGNYQWDVVALEPFARPIAGPTGDRLNAGRFINYALNNSPDAQFYLYAQWPQKTQEGELDFDRQWLTPYSGQNDETVRTRGYYQQLVTVMREDYGFLEKPILLVPAGDVMYELNQRMHAGLVPGFTDISQFYSDNIHLNAIGSYMLGMTFYATLFKQDPRGLAFDNTVITDPRVALQIQDAAWGVVNDQAIYTGVPEPASAMIVASGAFGLLVRRRARGV